MAVLNFTLSPEAVGKFYDALVCLGKFSENVCIEATNDKLLLTALNSSKSAYASFTLIGKKFFLKYNYQPSRRSGTQAADRFSCRIYNKALLSVFKGRVVDPQREKETAIERCDVSVEDGDENVKNRVIIKMMCRHGVLKTSRLTFQSVPPVHALFVKENAKNRWSISSKPLRELIEHFGPGTEQLDFYSDEGRMSLTSFTEKVVSNNEVLKQPLHTTVALDALEFSDFAVEEQLHIVISVKDFKTIISHAGISITTVKAAYSYPSSPMQLTYSDDGIISEFILMTIGEPRGGSVPAERQPSRANTKRAPSRQPLEARSNSVGNRHSSGMAPPPAIGTANAIQSGAKRAKVSKPSPPNEPNQSQLFFPDPDDDRKWDPVDYDDEDEPNLMWNDSNHTASNAGHVQSIGAHNEGRSNDSRTDMPPPTSTQRLAPTQRLSAIKGIFDDD